MPEALAITLSAAAVVGAQPTPPSPPVPPNPFGHLLDAGNRLGLVRHFNEPELRQVIALWKHDHTAVQKTVLEATQRRLQEYEPTPGPWQTQPIGEGYRINARIGERLVCIGETHPTRLRNAGPNARFLAAAVNACEWAGITHQMLEQDPDLIAGLVDALQQTTAVLAIFRREGYQTAVDGALDNLDRGAAATAEEILAALGKTYPNWSVSGVLPPAPEEAANTSSGGGSGPGEWGIVEQAEPPAQPDQPEPPEAIAENGGQQP